MKDWNVIVTIRDGKFKSAWEHLEQVGQVSRVQKKRRGVQKDVSRRKISDC